MANLKVVFLSPGQPNWKIPLETYAAVWIYAALVGIRYYLFHSCSHEGEEEEMLNSLDEEGLTEVTHDGWMITTCLGSEG
jgi:hypothetical protein